MEIIDCTPTWEGILPVLVNMLDNPSMKVRDNAQSELLKMARGADNWNAHIKAQQPENQ